MPPIHKHKRHKHKRLLGTLTGQSTVLVAILLVPLLSACPATSEEVRPPDDQFFFPTGTAITPDETLLFVANANSNLRYDSGSITPVDLDRVKEIATNWLTSGQAPGDRDCEVDKSFAYTLVCNEAEVVVADSTVRTGNFATELGVQELDSGLRLFAAVRGDPSLTWIDVDPVARTLECGGSGNLPRCDNDHRLSRMHNDASVGNIPSEPYGLFVDSTGQYVIVTHLTGAAISLADAPRDGSPPILSDAVGGIFLPDPSTRVSSALGVAARTPGGLVYVTSRSEDRVQMFTVTRIASQLPALVPAAFFFLRGVLPSDNGRGIRFSAAGDRAYVVNRSPPMLQVLDTSNNESGVPRNELYKAVEICSTASSLRVGDMGLGERVYVACFREGQVWSIDPGTGVIEAIIDVGRGPQSLEVSVSKQQLYVSNFLEDTVSVVDLTPGARTENRVVLKLGRTRQSGGN